MNSQFGLNQLFRIQGQVGQMYGQLAFLSEQIEKLKNESGGGESEKIKEIEEKLQTLTETVGTISEQLGPLNEKVDGLGTEAKTEKLTLTGWTEDDPPAPISASIQYSDFQGGINTVSPFIVGNAFDRYSRMGIGILTAAKDNAHTNITPGNVYIYSESSEKELNMITFHSFAGYDVQFGIERDESEAARNVIFRDTENGTVARIPFLPE